MSDPKIIQQGDFVTVDNADRGLASNVYIVARKLEGESLLQHPLAPAAYILRKDEELNLVAPIAKSHNDRCIEFLLKNKAHLDHNNMFELESIAIFYVIYRFLSARQLLTLAGLCGRIASIQLQHSTTLAIKMVNDNKALLNDFNLEWYANFKKIFSGKDVVDTKGKRSVVFNMAGFVLAQLDTN